MKPEIDTYALVLNNTKSINVSEDIFSAICFGTVLLMVATVYMLAKYTK